MAEIVVPSVPFPFRSEGPSSGIAPVVEDGRVVLTAAAGADLFIHPSGTSQRPDAERFLAEVTGDFVFSAHVTAEFSSSFDSGVLIGWIDAENWFKICSERDPVGGVDVVTVVTRGTSDDANGWEIGPSGAYLRIARMGNVFALHSSADAVRWSLVRYFSMGETVPDMIKLGVLAQSPTGAGTTATFTDVAFEARTLAAIRDGS
jgi:regulation of enolase protein 1 (concanavalin A-like superfamily)